MLTAVGTSEGGRERKEPRSDTMGERSQYDSIGNVNFGMQPRA